jgi:hypothetical protein
MLNLDDVREYLLQTNAIDDAEEVLLQTILQKSNANKEQKLQNSAALEKREMTRGNPDSVDAVSISQLLVECESLIDKDRKVKSILSGYLAERQTDENSSRNIQQLLSSDFRNNPEMNLEELEKLAQDEIMKLDRSKLEIQRKLEDHKLLLGNARNENNRRSFTNSDQQPSSRRIPVVDVDTSLQLQQRLLEGSNDYISKASKQQAESLATKQDLQYLNNMAANPQNWNSNYMVTKDANFSRHLGNNSNNNNNPNPSSRRIRSDSSDSNDPNNNSSSTAASTDSSRISPTALEAAKQQRVQNILNNVSNENYLTEKRKEIDLLKNREMEKQFYDNISLTPPKTNNNNNNNSNSNSNRTSTTNLQENRLPPKKALITAEGKIDRSVPTEEFLDKWLKEEMSIQPPAHVISSTQLPNPQQQIANVNNSNKSNSNRIPDNSNNSGRMSDVFDNMNVFKENTNNNNNIVQNHSPTNRRQYPVGEENNSYNGSRRRTFPRGEEPPEDRNSGREGGTGAGADYYNPKYSVDTNYRREPRANQQQQQQQQQMRFQNNQFPGNNPGLQGYSNPNYNYPPQQQQQQFMQPQQFPPQQQNPLVNMQMQKMADQLEYENRLLMQQLNPGMIDPFADPSMLMDPRFGNSGNSINSNLFQSNAANDPNNMYPLRRDDPNAFNNAMNKKELQRQQEIRGIQYEIEKLKYEKQLNDLKVNFEKEKLKTEKELEYEANLERSKNELQLIKMQQIIAKEKKLLELQQQQGGGGGADGLPLGMRNNHNNDDETILFNTYREESGCGLFPVPYDLCKGIAVIVEGVILPKALCSGNYYRIAVGIYDRQGAPVVKLIATQWNNWKTLPMSDISSIKTNNNPNPKSSAGGERMRPGSSVPASINLEGKDLSILEVEILQAIIFQTLKNSDIANKNSSGEYLLGLKCLVELQIKETETSPSQPIGFASVPLFTSNGQSLPQPILQPPMSRQSLKVGGSSFQTIDNNPIDVSQVVLKNNFWKGPIRKGISDPVSDPTVAPKTEDLLCPNAFFLLRMVDVNEFLRAANWKNLINGVIPVDEIMKLYLDPYQLRLEMDNNIPSSLRAPAAPSRPSSVMSTKESMKALNSSASAASVGLPPTSTRPASKLAATPRAGMKNARNLETLDEVEDLDETVPKTKNPPKRNISAAEYWMLGNPLGPCTNKYERGDGIDIYVDSARYLPDNVTISRVSLRFFTSNKQQVNNNKIHCSLSQLNSPSLHPIYQLKAELRGNNLNHTLIGVIRVDTIDSTTLLPGTVGYSIFRVFSTRDRKPITNIQENNIYMNSGFHQLPMFAGRIKTDLDTFDENLLLNSNCTRIPCASLLVRIFDAPKSSDGITTLSRDEFPKEEWLKLKLDYRLPDYGNGAYSGALCEPNTSELLAYEAKATVLKSKAGSNNNNNNTNSGNNAGNLSSKHSLQQSISAHPKSLSAGFPLRPASLMKPTGGVRTEEEMEEEVKYYESFFPSLDNMRTLINYNYIVPYHLDSGICVKLHSLYNLPDYCIALHQGKDGGGGGLFSSLVVGKNKNSNGVETVESDPVFIQKVICSLSPPALYYQEPPLSDHVFWTKTMDTTRNTRNPKYTDDPFYFYPAEMSFNLYLILDIRTLRMTTTTTTTTNAGKKSGSSSNPPANDAEKKLKFSLEQDPVLTNPDLVGAAAGGEKWKSSADKKKVAPVDNICKQFWTLLPISCEKYPGNGFKYVSSGFFQLPLMEGTFPSTIQHSSNSILKAFNLYEEMLNRVSLTDKLPSLTNFTRLSTDAASVLVQLYNPLLQDFYSLPNKTDTAPNTFKVVDVNQPSDIYLQKLFEILKARNPHENKDFDEEKTSLSQLFSGGANSNSKLMKDGKFLNPNFKMVLQQFKYSKDKFTHATPPSEGEKKSNFTTNINGGKILNQLLPTHLPNIQLMKEINDNFLRTTGLHDF